MSFSLHRAIAVTMAKQPEAPLLPKGQNPATGSAAGSELSLEGGGPFLDTLHEISRHVDVTVDGVSVRDLVPREAEEAASLVDKFLDYLANASRAQQVTAGGITGWLSGYLFSKFGRTVLWALGTTVVLVLIAEQRGWLAVDWNRVRSDIAINRQNLQQRVRDAAAPLGLVRRGSGRPLAAKEDVRENDGLIRLAELNRISLSADTLGLYDEEVREWGKLESRIVENYVGLEKKTG